MPNVASAPKYDVVADGNKRPDGRVFKDEAIFADMPIISTVAREPDANEEMVLVGRKVGFEFAKCHAAFQFSCKNGDLTDPNVA
jgi:hypothetical protein